MLIRYCGSGTRLVGPYEWSQRNGMVQDVDAETAAQMLTQPGEVFEVAEEEPLLGIVGTEEAALLALSGVNTTEELAKLKAAQVSEVARSLGVKPEQVRTWKRQAARAVRSG